jgi:hypothetical protein
VPFRNAIFRGIIATERCCFAQLLKVVHSVSDKCFFAPLRKAIRYSGNVSTSHEEISVYPVFSGVLLALPLCMMIAGRSDYIVVNLKP